MVMRVLIATGGAPHSNTAVRLGGRFAAALAGTVTLLAVVKHDSDRPKGAAIVQQAQTLMPAELTAVTAKVRCGQPAEEIVAEARAGAYNLVVLGSKPEHPLFTRLLGSVAYRVITQVDCPVLVGKAEPAAFQNILICESGREPSLLERLTVQLPTLLTSEKKITVLHVMSQMIAAPGVPEWELHASAAELMGEHTPEGEILEHDVMLLDHIPANSQAKIRHGLVVDEIVAEANSGAYDLVIMGTHLGAGWERLLLDDVSQAVVAQVKGAILFL